MLGEPILPVTCDDCGEETDCGLTGIARGGYDERNVEASLKGQGWLVKDGKHYCWNCREDHE